MATKRIDIAVYNGRVSVTPVQGYSELKNLEDNRILITTGSWKIIVDPDSTFINCSSKAKKKKRNFKIATMNGSLFLYNSTNDWYWYFRKKKLQFILDINKVDSVKMWDGNEIVLPCCFTNNNGVLGESSLEKTPTLKYFGDNASSKFDKAHITVNGDSSIVVASIKFTFDKFLLVECMPNHCKMYVNKHYKIEDLFKEGYLDNVRMKSVIRDLE